MEMQVEKIEPQTNLVSASEKKEEVFDSTVFVRNIPLEIDEQEFYQFFRKLGKIYYAKICKNPNDEYHKGTGFVKFHEPEMSQKLIKISEEMSRGTYAPSDDDPVLEMEGEIQLIYPALSRDNVQGKLDWRKDMKEKKDKDGNAKPSKINFKNIRDLQQQIDMDKMNKRKLGLSLRGLFKEEDSMIKQESDKNQRRDHEAEKLEKLKNPNTFVSDTRIFLKNIDRHLDESRLKQCVLETMDIKKISRKIVKKVMLYRDPETSIVKGTAHIDFVTANDALEFITKIETTDSHKLYNLKRVPIIEFALENALKVLKHERVLKSVIDKRIESKKGIMDERSKTKTKVSEEKKKKFADGKKMEKGKVENNKKLQKMKISEIEKGTFKPTPQECHDLIELGFGRGPRQRLKKKLVKLGFVVEAPDVEIVPKEGDKDKKGKKEKPKQIGKKEKKDFIEKRKEQVKSFDENQVVKGDQKKAKARKEKSEEMLRKRMPDEERAVANQVKNKKRQKQKKDGKDAFDDLAEEYVNRKDKVKKPKWFG